MSRYEWPIDKFVYETTLIPLWLAACEEAGVSSKLGDAWHHYEGLDELDVCGEYLGAADLWHLLGKKAGALKSQMAKSGSPPEAILLHPNFPDLSRMTRLALGWEYWCRTQGIPSTDADLFYVIEPESAEAVREGSCDVFAYSVATKMVPCPRETERSGVLSFLRQLASSAHSPEKTLGAWLSAFVVDFGFIARDYTFQQSLQLEQWHHRNVTQTLPYGTNYRLDTALRRSSRDGRESFAANLFWYLGVLVEYRRLWRETGAAFVLFDSYADTSPRRASFCDAANSRQPVEVLSYASLGLPENSGR